MKRHVLSVFSAMSSAMLGCIPLGSALAHAEVEPGDPVPASQRPAAPTPLIPGLPCQKLATTPLIYASKSSDDPLHMRVQCTMDKGQDGLWRAKSCQYHPKWDGFYMPRYIKAERYRETVTNYMEHACFTDGQLTPFLTDEQNDQPDSIPEEDAWTYRTITPWGGNQVAQGISPAQDGKIGAAYQHSTEVRLKLSFTHVPPVTAEENDTDKAAHSPKRFSPAVSIINLDEVSSRQYHPGKPYQGEGGFFSPVVSMIKGW